MVNLCFSYVSHRVAEFLKSLWCLTVPHRVQKCPTVTVSQRISQLFTVCYGVYSVTLGLTMFQRISHYLTVSHRDYFVSSCLIGSQSFTHIKKILQLLNMSNSFSYDLTVANIVSQCQKGSHSISPCHRVSQFVLVSHDVLQCLKKLSQYLSVSYSFS